MNPPVTRPTYQAVIDMFPPSGVPRFSYALIKFSYEIKDTRCVLTQPEALFHDLRDANLRPRWARGTDFWPSKVLTDVAVRGSAFGFSGRPATRRRVSVSIGARRREIDVFGPRRLVWERGVPHFTAPEPFTEVPMDWDLAYGGWDARVPVDAPETVDTAMRLQLDHPGVYPRNPFGLGYLVLDEPVAEGVRLPQLEDPTQLLDIEKIFVRDPRFWYRQPLPAGLDFTHAMMFHRYSWLGARAWYPPPPGARLAEVEAGALPTNFHELEELDPTVDPPPLPFYQEAAIGMSCPQPPLLEQQSFHHATPLAVEPYRLGHEIPPVAWPRARRRWIRARRPRRARAARTPARCQRSPAPTPLEATSAAGVAATCTT